MLALLSLLQGIIVNLLIYDHSILPFLYDHSIMFSRAMRDASALKTVRAECQVLNVVFFLESLDFGFSSLI